jgi:hypothetical protein
MFSSAGFLGLSHRLNMELNLQSLFWLHVHSCIHWLGPRNHPPPPHLGSYTRALFVSQDRRDLFVTPWLELKSDDYPPICEEMFRFLIDLRSLVFFHTSNVPSTAVHF